MFLLHPYPIALFPLAIFGPGAVSCEQMNFVIMTSSLIRKVISLILKADDEEGRYQRRGDRLRGDNRIETRAFIWLKIKVNLIYFESNVKYNTHRNPKYHIE